MDWTKSTALDTPVSVEEALRRWYKPERLNRTPGTLERLAESTTAALEREGWGILASRHESATGHPLYIRRTPAGLELHQDS